MITAKKRRGKKKIERLKHSNSHVQPQKVAQIKNQFYIYGPKGFPSTIRAKDSSHLTTNQQGKMEQTGLCLVNEL